jgi:hypothetical protein
VLYSNVVRVQVLDYLHLCCIFALTYSHKRRQMLPARTIYGGKVTTDTELSGSFTVHGLPSCKFHAPETKFQFMVMTPMELRNIYHHYPRSTALQLQHIDLSHKQIASNTVKKLPTLYGTCVFTRLPRWSPS